MSSVDGSKTGDAFEGPDDFRELVQTGSRKVRNRLVERHTGLAVHIAGRYRDRGVPDDDLRQVAVIGLVKAVDRFDPDRGIAFSTYAGRTIEGEIKRYFRDKTWTVRVPRSMKNLHLDVRRVADGLAHGLGRAPRVGEIAAELGVTADEVIEAMSASGAYSPRSFDAPTPGSDEAAIGRQATLGTQDRRLAGAVDRVMVERLIDSLDEREQEIVRLRFWEGLTQSEIAERVGISQMHVSRLLRRSFEQMRRFATSTPAGPDDG